MLPTPLHCLKLSKSKGKKNYGDALQNSDCTSKETLSYVILTDQDRKDEGLNRNNDNVDGEEINLRHVSNKELIILPGVAHTCNLSNWRN